MTAWLALILILSIFCGLLACIEVGTKLVKHSRLKLKSLRWMRMNSGYMARYRQ